MNKSQNYTKQTTVTDTESDPGSWAKEAKRRASMQDPNFKVVDL